MRVTHRERECAVQFLIYKSQVCSYARATQVTCCISETRGACVGRGSERVEPVSRMDILPSGGIFRELQVVHDTGYFSGQASLEEDWHQVY